MAAAACSPSDPVVNTTVTSVLPPSRPVTAKPVEKSVINVFGTGSGEIDLANQDASITLSQKPAASGGLQALAAGTVTEPNISFVRKYVGFTDDDANNVRYVYATFEASNNSVVAFKNFTLWGLDTPNGSTAPGSFSPPTLGGTMFSKVQNAFGANITDLNEIRKILPTHQMKPAAAGPVVDSDFANLHWISPAEQTEVNGSGITSLASRYPSAGTNAGVLGYGYRVSKSNASANSIGAGSGSGCFSSSCRGLITFAWKIQYPNNAGRTLRPFVLNFNFAMGDQTTEYISESLEEQGTNQRAGQPTLSAGYTERVLGSASTILANDQGIENLCSAVTARASGLLAAVSITGTLFPSVPARDPCYLAGGAGLKNFYGTNFTISSSTAQGAVVDQYSRLIVVGSAVGYGTINRYNQNGTADGSFNGNGEFQIPGYHMKAVTVDNSTGKIIVAGTKDPISPATQRDVIVVRFNDNGTPDTTFNANATVTFNVNADDDVSAVQVDAAGRIYVGGTSDNSLKNFFGYYKISRFFIARLINSGLDISYDSDGIKTNLLFQGDDILRGIAVDGSGNAYVCGTTSLGNYTGAGILTSAGDFAVARLDNSGQLLTSFNSFGFKVFDARATSSSGALSGLTDRGGYCKLDNSGRLLMAGSSGSEGFDTIMRFSSTNNGSFDAGFGTNGFAGGGIDAFRDDTTPEHIQVGGLGLDSFGRPNIAMNYVNFSFFTVFRNGYTTTGVFNGGVALNVPTDSKSNAIAYDNVAGRIYMIGDVPLASVNNRFFVLRVITGP